MNKNDLYIQQILLEKKHLFREYLSKYSIRAYRELYREVGVLFEAILVSKLSDAIGSLEEERLD